MNVNTAVFLLLIPLFTCGSKSCSDKCYFLLNDLSGNVNRSEDFTRDVPPDRHVTGIITIDAEFKKNSSRFTLTDTLRFSKTNRSGYADPLVLAVDVYYEKDVRDVIDRNQLVAWGIKATFPNIEKDESLQYFDRPPYKFKIFPSTGINIQISDMNVTVDQFYEFYVGKPGQSEYWPFNYGSSAMLQRFAEAGITLNSTSTIQNKDPSNLTVYHFISVCSDPQPVLCDSPEEMIDVVLGAKYTLSCSGSGAPYLSAIWDKDTYKPTSEESVVIVANETADNFIESTMLIESFTVDHIGTWTCTIFNLNFQGYMVHKKYVFQYSEAASLITCPLAETYDPEDGNTTFVWKIEGWPLEQIHLQCNIGLAGTHEIVREPQFYTKVPPRLTITLVLTTATTQGLIKCQLLNQDAIIIMDDMTITKVGDSCVPGQYGAGKSCYYCSRGETSPGGGTKCNPVSNSCREDQFGEGTHCRICPWGTVTFPTDIAAKEEDCRNVSRTSQCPSGAYGYGDTSECRACPETMTSIKGAAKNSDCFKVKSFCGRLNHWGTNNNCTPCLDQQTSGQEAVKPQDCLPLVEKTGGENWVLIVLGVVGIVVAGIVTTVGIIKAYSVWRDRRNLRNIREFGFVPGYDLLESYLRTADQELEPAPGSGRKLVDPGDRIRCESGYNTTVGSSASIGRVDSMRSIITCG